MERYKTLHFARFWKTSFDTSKRKMMEKIVLFLQDDCLEISQSADAWFRTKAYVNGRAAGVIGSGSMRIPVKPGETIRIDVYDGDGETFYGSTVFSCEGDRLIRQLGGSAGVDFRIAEAPYDLQQAVLEVGRSLDWASFRWLPSSSVVPGESSWHRFVETHTEQELQRVLEEAKRQQIPGYQ